MVPIISVSDAVCAVLSLFIFVIIWRRYQKKQYVAYKYFAYFYLSLVTFFICGAIPGLVTENGTFIALAAIIGYTALLVGVSYLLCVPLIVYGRTTIEATLFYGIVVVGVIMAILNIMFISPAVKVSSGPFVYYLVQEPSVLRVLVGAIPLLVALFAVVMFIREGYRLAQKASVVTSSIASTTIVAEQRENTHRSYMIAAGLGLLVLAGFVNFIIYAIYPSGEAFLVAAIFADPALVVIALGVER